MISGHRRELGLGSSLPESPNASNDGPSVTRNYALNVLNKVGEEPYIIHIVKQ